MPFSITMETVKYPDKPNKEIMKTTATLHGRTHSLEDSALKIPEFSLCHYRNVTILQLKSREEIFQLDELGLKYIWKK